MVKIASAIALFLTASTCYGFIPSSAFTRNAAKGVSKSNQQLSMVEGDTSFGGIDLNRLLGAKRLSNIRRKLKREKNANAPKPAASKPKAKVSTKKPLGIIIAGAPASGKGTQCEMIVNSYSVVHLSTGDMLRAAVAAGSDVGKAAKEYMDSGKLVPDEVIIGIVSILLFHVSFVIPKVRLHLYWTTQ